MDRLYNRFMDEEWYYYRHSTGLSVYVIPRRQYPKCFGAFSVCYGSIDNQLIKDNFSRSIVIPDGSAHFLKHIFLGKNDFDYSRLDFSLKAHTNYTTTTYLFEFAGDTKLNIDVLLRKFKDPNFTDENIEKTKEIIKREISENKVNAAHMCYSNLIGCLYKRYPVKKEATGTTDSLSKIGKDILYECYDAFYRPSNCILLVIGDINGEEIYELVDKKMIHSRNSRKNIVKRIYPHEPPEINESYIEQKLDVSSPFFAIGFKDNDVGYNGRSLLKKELETMVLLEVLFGKNSNLIRRLYDQDLITDKLDIKYFGEKDFGHSVISGRSERPDNLYRIIFDYLFDNKYDKLVDENLFNATKKRLTDKFLVDLNSVEYISTNFVSYYMKRTNLLNYVDVLNGIEYEDVLKRFKKHLSKSNAAVSVIYPA